ncbi:hypothetical protein LEMA_P072300.1 [Plenodomus lingam JN3]|uniref:ATP synthase protein 8 n=2 Tax=Leptosphaeria maculans TaxID=5022 RepID=E4ZKC7_LEPMJ|nr:hypothetical protein LEMA_P072300.1 [Plenodomus lingam JN3]CBX91722.1 hypothetical protein LEMA_P072300.1 [Plenodomus lingam JN3]
MWKRESFCRRQLQHRRLSRERKPHSITAHLLRAPKQSSSACLTLSQPTMNARFLRPFTRAAFRAPTAVRPTAMARPALVASQTKKPEVGPQQMTVLKSAMPQLIPFFFVNETTVAFILLPSLIYVFSKYILPNRVRLFAARLFISKL